MASAKQAHALVSYFVKEYEKKYHRPPVVNRYGARWGFDAILMSMNDAEAVSLIDYYFTTASSKEHSIEWFFNNYEKLLETKKKTDEDREHLARLREASKRRTEEWRKRINGDR